MVRQRKSKRGGNGSRRLILYTDGAIRRGATGLGVVVRDAAGRVVAWRSKRLCREMTCNEAEYEALLFGLETVCTLQPVRVEVRMDSQVVVNQMLGLFTVRNQSLRRLHARARALVATLDLGIDGIEFVYVRRLRNRLADALANEAAEGEWEMGGQGDRGTRGQGEGEMGRQGDRVTGREKEREGDG